MSQPAAALGDLAAHGGTILTGSTNVLIGGRPAARVGDTVVCALHGTGVISKGSATVLINGMPAARLLDFTGCMVPGLAPMSVPAPTLGPPTAPITAKPIEGARSFAPEFDHQMHEQTDKSKSGVTALHAEGRISDGNNNGHLDTIEGSFEGVRMRNAGQKDIGGAELGGTHSLDVLYGNARASYMPAPNGGEGGSVSGTAEAGMMKWAAGGTVGAAGSKGLNPILGVTGEANMMHAKADGDLLIGSDENRVGLIGKGEAGAEAIKGEVAAVHTMPLPFGANMQVVGKASGALATVGGGAGAWLYYDKKQGRLRGGIMGILKVLVGLGAEVEVSIGRPFQEDPPAAPTPPASPPAAFGGYFNTPGFGPAGLPGTILLGNPTVLIGG
jgi:uncharacterized Zn-binding protein involved in type VI secretion